MGGARRKGEFEPVKRKKSWFEEMGGARTDVTGVRALPREKNKEGKDAPLEKLRSMAVGKPTGIIFGNVIISSMHCEKNLVVFVLFCLVFTTRASRTVMDNDKLSQRCRPTLPAKC